MQHGHISKSQFSVELRRCAAVATALLGISCGGRLDAGADDPPPVNEPVTLEPSTDAGASKASQPLDSRAADAGEPLPRTEQPVTAPTDAGITAASTQYLGDLPVDHRSPVVVLNDGPFDNWQGEYALTLASAGHIQLEAIIVNNSSVYPEVEDSVQGWRDMVQAARDSGMQNIPDPVASITSNLVRPDNSEIQDTQSIRSEGALLLIELAMNLATTQRPLAVASGGTLTDLADAYLIEPAIADRIVVVANVGRVADNQVHAGSPNGDIDPWATAIVASVFSYVQVNSFYRQLEELSDERVADLPDNAFGRWMNDKRPTILELLVACDQISLMALAFPEYAVEVNRLQVNSIGADSAIAFSPEPNGNIWHVRSGDTNFASQQFWRALRAPSTYTTN